MLKARNMLLLAYMPKNGKVFSGPSLVSRAGDVG